MGERARLLGGELTIESRPGEGTRIHVRIPWPSGGEPGTARPPGGGEEPTG
jgi:hypothetical protein